MKTLFDSDRLDVKASIALTAASLREHGTDKHWAIAFSGGKDSTALVTVIPYLIETGQVPRPKSLSVLYADTRMELPPLQTCAMAIIDQLNARGINARVVLPPLDERFFVYMLGRGVPPPKNKFRWCTPMLKVNPMLRSLWSLAVDRGFGEVVQNPKTGKDVYHGFGGDKLLMLTGVRVGESAARDQRISLSCSRDGAECGQGWFQETTPEALADTLAPILHWRICNVWEWLTKRAPDGWWLKDASGKRLTFPGFPTAFAIADVYGGQNELESTLDLNGRTGCVGCNLASKDTALQRVLRIPSWAHLEPLTRLRPLYAELQLWHNRVRKDGSERKVDGTLVKNPGRVGPLTMHARRMGLREVLAIQDEVNAAAHRLGRPGIDLINDEELVRIMELIDANTWPQGWSGDEISGNEDVPDYYADGTVQQLLFAK